MDRAREMGVKFLCGAISGMREATEREQQQFRRNTQSEFDLLAVRDTPGLPPAHIAKPQHAGYFDMERINKYDGHWFDQTPNGLARGEPVSGLSHGRRAEDPILKKTVDLLRQFAPDYVSPMMLHGSAFPGLSLQMCADFVDRATYKDGTLSPENRSVVMAYLSALESRDSVQPEYSKNILDPGEYRALLDNVDRDMNAELELMLGDWNEDVTFEVVPVQQYL